MTSLELTPGQTQALNERGFVQGKDYILMRPSTLLEMLGFASEDELLALLEPTLREIERGECAEWSVEEFLSRMHRERSSAG
jgi:hypothetical protein